MSDNRKEMNTLSELKTGESGIIVKVHGHGGFRHRILELGFVRGERVDVIKNAPLLDPVEYEIMGSHVSLRHKEAEMIDVLSLSAEAHPDIESDYHGTIEEHVRREAQNLGKQITVALVGNPNCGKTSFFNYATGMREKVGNYSGVTVDSKIGTFHHRGYTINLVDLPGTYSLTEYSPDEMYVRDFLDHQPLDIILNIVNAGNLERNMLLTTQLIDRNQPMVMALNMYDELQASGDKLDHDALAGLLGFPVVPVIARTGWGIDNVLEAIVQVYEGTAKVQKHIHINYGADMEEAISTLKQLLNESDDLRDIFHPRYIALKLLENDKDTNALIEKQKNAKQILQTAKTYRDRFEKEYDEDMASAISDLRFGFIRGALGETMVANKKKERLQLGYSLDKVLTNRWLGFPILGVFLFLMFEITFVLGAYPQEWIETGMSALGDWVRDIMPAGIMADLLVDGVIAGAGAVLVFLPQILILFFFISILEDTGYMARAAFIMDKLMHRMGLHGKSFIPYIIGFGCTVPAVLASRTLENPKDRILTIITVPFVSCSARLPVYILLVAAFFPSHQALVMLSIYVIGLIFAILTAVILNKTSFKEHPSPFVMELPPYRIPTLRNALIHMWDKASEWFKRVSTIVLLTSVIIWALGYFPRPKEQMSKQQQMEQSYMASVGHAIEPVFAPLGFDWRADVSLVAGMAAKEVIVSSMAVLYGVDDENIEDDSQPLAQKLTEIKDADGNQLYSPIKAYTLMLFILLYFPCISTLATIRQEIGNKWMLFSALFNTALAWLMSFVFYNIAILF